MSHSRRLLILASLASAVSACSGPPSTAPAASSPWRLPPIAAPDHYALTITPDLPRATFAGAERIDLRILETTSRIVLNSAEIAIQIATVEAGGQTQPAQVTFDEKTQTATLAVPSALSPGPAVLSITYTGILNDQLRGLYLSQANNRRYAVSQLEATDARRMFPSFDEPAFKATFDLTAIIDASDHAISNGAVVSDTPGPLPGKHSVKFSTTPKMSSYLVALVVGDFECVSGAADGIPIRVCATPDKKALTSLALADAQDVMHYYDQYFAIKYPYGKLDVVAVPDFAAGAMENTAAIFYRETDLLADAKTASVGVRQSILGILSHEMAHQWFGDLVTMRWWNDIWLNEGFATWMETKPAKALHPEWHEDLLETQGNLQAMAVDALTSTRPIRNPADTPDEINEAFDAIAYQKGGAILRMVEAYLGEPLFQKGINAYLDAFKFGNASGDEFWKAMTDATGKPVDKIMASFAEQPGVPLVTVKASCAGSSTKVDLAQERYHTPTQTATAESWQIPVCFRGPTTTTPNAPGGGAVACELLPGARASFTQESCRTWVVANANGTGYYRTAYDGPVLTALTRDIALLSEPERIMLASDTWWLVKSGRHDIGTYIDLATGLAIDRTSVVVETISGALDAIDTSIAARDDRGAFRSWVVRTFRPVLQEVGWTPVPREPDDRLQLRADIVGLVAGVGHDPEARAKARTLVDSYLKKPASLDATLAAVLVPIVAEDGDAALFDAYLAHSKSAASPEDRDRLLYALGSFTDPALVKRTVELSLSPDVRTQDTASILTRALAGPVGHERVWPLVRDRWNDVMHHIDPSFGLSNIVGALGSFCDAGAATELDQFFKTHDAKGAERTVKQSIEQVRACAALKAAQAPKLAAWVGAGKLASK